MLTEHELHNKIDDIIIEFPGEFPDGPNFLSKLEEFLTLNTHDWKLFFIDNKLHIQFDGNELIRESDGGR